MFSSLKYGRGQYAAAERHRGALAYAAAVAAANIPVNSAPNQPVTNLSAYIMQTSVTIGDWTMTVPNLWESRDWSAASAFYSQQYMGNWGNAVSSFGVAAVTWKNDKEKVLVRKYQMYTSADGSSLGTLSWRLEGSDDGVTWDILDSVDQHAIVQDTDPLTRQLASNNTSYYYHRIRVTEVNTVMAIGALKAWSVL